MPHATSESKNHHSRTSSSGTYGPVAVAPRSSSKPIASSQNEYYIPPQAPYGGYAPVNQASPLPNTGMGIGGFSMPNVDIGQIQNDLEGPKPLRVIAGLGGLVMAAAAALGLLNIVAYVTHPIRITLEVYEVVFGLVIVVLEIKSFSHGFKKFLYRWFPFVSTMLGKGAFYLFAGSLGASFGWTNLLLFCPGVFVGAMGVLYVLMYMGQCKTMEDKYEQSMAVSYYVPQ